MRKIQIALDFHWFCMNEHVFSFLCTIGTTPPIHPCIFQLGFRDRFHLTERKFYGSFLFLVSIRLGFSWFFNFLVDLVLCSLYNYQIIQQGLKKG